MITISNYESGMKALEDLSEMYKTGGESSFSLYDFGPSEIRIDGAWLKKNREAVPFLIDLFFRLAKNFGRWGTAEGISLQDPPMMIDQILSLEDVIIRRYDISESKYALVVLDKVLKELGVEFKTESPEDSLSGEGLKTSRG